MFGANLVIPAQIFYKLLYRRIKFPRIPTQDGLNVKVNESHFRYQPGVSQDPCLVQIWWLQLKFMTRYLADKPKFLVNWILTYTFLHISKQYTQCSAKKGQLNVSPKYEPFLSGINMNYYPLFRVMSWNYGMRCMYFYILILIQRAFTKKYFMIERGVWGNTGEKHRHNWEVCNNNIHNCNVISSL